MKSVLFVDDEPKVLMALRRMLHSMNREWNMGFANGSEEALRYLAEHHCDVVVTDMRMPGMDGAQLLEAVRAQYPATVRVILSGQSAQERTLRAVGPAHQFLSKPCDANALKATIQRSCALRDRLTDHDLVSLVSKVGTLPSVPSVYGELLDEIESPDASIPRIGEIIGRDAGMTAKVLQLTNSSFFGLPVRLTDPTQAVMQLGLDRIRLLVVTAGAFCRFESAKVPGELLERLMNHSTAVGSLASRIAASFHDNKQFVQDVFTAGMLHDIGVLVLLVCLADEYQLVVSYARQQELPLHMAETKLLGATHGEIGAYLMSLWGLPDPVVEAIAWHNTPTRCPTAEFSPLAAVHIANALQEQHSPWNPPSTAEGPDVAYLEQIRMADRLPAWQQLAAELACENAPA